LSLAALARGGPAGRGRAMGGRPSYDSGAYGPAEAEAELADKDVGPTGKKTDAPARTCCRA